jgi:hypothetical protein
MDVFPRRDCQTVFALNRVFGGRPNEHSASTHIRETAETSCFSQDSFREGDSIETGIALPRGIRLNPGVV